MKINFEKLIEKSLQANSSQCHNVTNIIYDCVNRYLYEIDCNDKIINFLKDLGILEETGQKNIVEPFNFMTNGSSNS